jgi:phosphoribosyl 1,2-cyclic phosphate phosphodiesterase
MGLDEVRRFNMLTKQPMPMYGTRATLADLRRTFGYVFRSDAPRGGGVPDLRLWPLEGACCFGGTEVVPVPVQHGPGEVLGFLAVAALLSGTFATFGLLSSVVAMSSS